MNKKIGIEACDVSYVFVDGEAVPVIFSRDKENIKNIVTDEIAPASLLSKETIVENVGELSEFGQKLFGAEDKEVYTLFKNFDEVTSVSLFLEYANIWDRCTNPIVKYVYDHGFNVNPNHMFTVGDYKKLAGFLERANERKAVVDGKETQIEEAKEKAKTDYEDMFKF